MEEENEQAQEEIVEQEEQISEESNEETQEDDSITLSKAEFNKLKRQSIAYKANKDKPEKVEQSQTGLSYESLFAVRDISKDDFEALKDEAETLGVPVEKYIKTESSKVFLKDLQAKRKSNDASLSPSSKSPVYKKFTQEDLSKMSSSELEKILPKD